MIDIVRLCALSRVLPVEGIVFNGEIYEVSHGATDGYLEYGSGRQDLRFIGTLENILAVDELVHAHDIKRFKQETVQAVFDRYVAAARQYGSDISLVAFQCIYDVIPYLDEFDPRVPNMPRDDLIELRREELVPFARGMKDKVTKAEVRSAIASGLGFIAKELEEAAELSEKPYKRGRLREDKASITCEDEFDFDQTFLRVRDEEGLKRNYELAPRKARGDVVFKKKGRERLIFKKGERIRRAQLYGSLSSTRHRQYLMDASMEITDRKLDAFGRYFSRKGGVTNMEDELDYHGSGFQFIGGRFFVYTTPMGFAMHDIREGHTEKWYPFPDPPKVGVTIHSRGDEIYVSQAGVEGDFDYLHFNSKRGEIKGFCGPQFNTPSYSDDWTEKVVGSIMHGVNTLFNGMNEDSLREYEAAGSSLSYSPPLAQRQWITRDQVREMGLLETNIHPTVSMRDLNG